MSAKAKIKKIKKENKLSITVKFDLVAEFKNAYKVYNTNLELYSCSCGAHGKFKNYYSTQNFKCPTCGEPIYSSKNTNRSMLHTTAEIPDQWTKEGVNQHMYLYCYSSTGVNIKQINYNENNTKDVELLVEKYYIYFETEDDSTIVKIYRAHLRYDIETNTFYKINDIEILKNNKPVSVKVTDVNNKFIANVKSGKIKAHIPNLQTLEEQEENKENDVIKKSPAYAFLKEANMISFLQNGYNYSYNNSTVILSNRYHLNLEGTNLESITGFSKSICKEIRDYTVNEFWSTGSHTTYNHSYVRVYEFYNEHINKQKIDINIIRNLQKTFVELYKKNVEVNEFYNNTGNIGYNNRLEFEALKDLHLKYGYSLNTLQTYLNDCHIKQGKLVGETVSLLKDMASLCELLEIKKYEKYPDSVVKEHDKLSLQFSLVKQEMHDKKINLIAEENKELEDDDDNFKLILPRSSKEFLQEGRALSHCVNSYVERVVREETLVAFLRKAEDNSSSSTLEIKNNRIVQHKAYGNSSPSKEEKAFVKKWAKQHNIICA